MKAKRKSVSPILVKREDFKLNKRSRKTIKDFGEDALGKTVLAEECIDYMIGDLECMSFPVIAKYVDENLSFQLVKVFSKESLAQISWNDLISPYDDSLPTFTSVYLDSRKDRAQISKQIDKEENMLIAEKVDYLNSPKKNRVILKKKLNGFSSSKKYRRISIKDPSMEMLNFKNPKKSPLDIALVEKFIPPKFKINDLVVPSHWKENDCQGKAPFIVDSVFFVDSINALIELLGLSVGQPNARFNYTYDVLGSPADYIGTWFYMAIQLQKKQCQNKDNDTENIVLFSAETHIKPVTSLYNYKDSYSQKPGIANNKNVNYLQYFYYIADNVSYPASGLNGGNQLRGILMSLSEYPLTGIPSFLSEKTKGSDSQEPRNKRSIPVLTKDDPDDEGVIPQFVNAVTLNRYTLEPESIVFVDTRCLVMELSKKTISEFLEDRAYIFRDVAEFAGGVLCKT